ncbi:CPBP family intramembrane metalloprotease [Microbulbifer thermotolerans]|uniref:CPBP family intramembrane glutamic endopeptidase n=1 Tax=Microbulbifer thermotolerans TaxID=252514 RepID=UPI00224B59E0|nr:CPBP family intramembrane glutamic endopeptidase [Microbulbifer thermotolerans]MCX2783932.1 CPBP family intramembrane metalloprotease [Microbulbifer thermotolerans]MCX2840844.1 CPBP family intramembrane metalloprotease [Microbulbifer thermotolerans]
MLSANSVRTDSNSAKPLLQKNDAIAVAALLSLCALPLGWAGLVAPFLWLLLHAIESSVGWKRALAYGFSALLMLAAASGQVPGSERIALMPPYINNDGNRIYASFNAGKAAIAAAVMAFMIRRRQWFKPADLPIVLAAIALPFFAGLMIYGPSLKFGAAIGVAALINLLVVCISEEGFFRWVLQRGGELFLGRWIAALVVTALFTLLHTGWAVSPLALGLVSLAGFGYALLWCLRRNFWVCVLAHWGVNLLHLLFLPYPLPA